MRHVKYLRNRRQESRRKKFDGGLTQTTGARISFPGSDLKKTKVTLFHPGSGVGTS